MVEDYINDYLNNTIIITGNSEDYILSCHIRYDLNQDTYISSQVISRTLLKHKSIRKKIMLGSMHYIGVKYK
jgi:hypothetical protein